MVDQQVKVPSDSTLPVTGPFPPEIWREIFLHTRLPVPAPLSKPKRSELRQNSLTALARTCKLFNSLIIPLLYKTVVTDDFASFIETRRSPSRRPLLGLVENLYVEYQEAYTARSYACIIKYGGRGWDTVGPTSEQEQKLQMERCEGESTDLHFAIVQSNCHNTQIFPHLTTVSVGSIYGHQGDLWSRYSRYEMEQTREGREASEVEDDLPPFSMLHDARDMWDYFLSTTTVAHVCIRDPAGPLGFPLHRVHPEKRPFEKVIHFAPDTPGLALHLGRNPTWVSDVPQDQAFNPIWVAVRNSIRDLTVQRARTGGAKPGRFYQVDIYGSTRYIGTPDPSDTMPHIHLTLHPSRYPDEKHPRHQPTNHSPSGGRQVLMQNVAAGGSAGRHRMAPLARLSGLQVMRLGPTSMS